MENLKRLSEDDVKKDISDVIGFATNPEKLSWRRKYKKMQGLLDELKPIEDQFLDLIKQQQPILDKVETLRSEMVKECIHPKDYLVHKGTHLECKFCNSIIKPIRNNG